MAAEDQPLDLDAIKKFVRHGPSCHSGGHMPWREEDWDLCNCGLADALRARLAAPKRCEKHDEPLRLYCEKCDIAAEALLAAPATPTPKENDMITDLAAPQNPAPWPDPTPEMLNDPRFEAVWQCIKSWDINVPSVYGGYEGATGNHVRAILDALAALPSPARPLQCDQCELKSSDWGTPLSDGDTCPRHYLDDDSCDGVMRFPSPARPQVETSEFLRGWRECKAAMLAAVKSADSLLHDLFPKSAKEAVCTLDQIHAAFSQLGEPAAPSSAGVTPPQEDCGCRTCELHVSDYEALAGEYGKLLARYENLKRSAGVTPRVLELPKKWREESKQKAILGLQEHGAYFGGVSAALDNCANELEELVRDALPSLPADVSTERTIVMRQPFTISGRLGVGAEAWVELEDIERRGIALRNNDRSGMSISWRTFRTVMNALRHCGEQHYVNPSLPAETPTKE